MINEIFTKLNYLNMGNILLAKLAFRAYPWLYDLEILTTEEIIYLNEWLHLNNYLGK